MKKIRYILIIAISLSTGLINAQSKNTGSADSTIRFKVFGNCEMCKERIEEAAKGKGVQSAEWNQDTKILTLTVDPFNISLDKIQARIVAAGHDLENKKAKDIIYKELPECCQYREKKPTEPSNALAEKIRGVVLEATNKGSFNPLFHANIQWLSDKSGVMTDSLGYFEISRNNGEETQLVISYVGYQSDTITVTHANELKIVLASNNQLKGVTVSNSVRSSYFSSVSTVRTEVITSKELLKAACCNLSESFETNPSVDVSYNDAVTGSKQIQLLGLSGNYTQLTVENLPGPRGIATPLGLNSIAGPWIESIQLTKGVGSVVNGYESIAGQINVELKKPESAENILANVYVNEFGKTDINFNISSKLNKKWSNTLLLHDNFLLNNQVDFNKDGFRDLPTGNQFGMVYRYKYDDGNGWMAQFGMKMMTDNRTGGETDFNKSKDFNTTRHYGLGINTERYEGFAKLGYVYPQKVYKSIGLQLALIRHQQDAYFGLTGYNALQKSIYANLIYQSIIGTTIHKFRTGLSLQHDIYNEDFKATNYKRDESVSGAFIEYTFTPSDKFSTVTGLRIDQHNLYGSFFTPRFNLRYEPIKKTIIRASFGRGQRTANIFAENNSVLVSARQVMITPSPSGIAYGLNPEIAWNKGISIDQKFRIFNHEGSISFDYFRNDFTDQVIVDLENPRLVHFYNLQGKSYSNSFQGEISVTPITKLDIRMAYRYFDVKATYGNELLQRPFTSGHRSFISADYSFNNWKLDYTITYNGKKRIPNTATNPVNYQQPSFSPDFYLMSAQISRKTGTKYPMDFYIGAENITNFFQRNVIVSSEQPFSPYFDASMVWGPVNGRMLYAGWRLTIK